MKSQKLALVLGATGGIGGEVAKHLLLKGYKIRALTRSLSHPRAQLYPEYEWQQGDVMNAADVLRAAEGAAIIVHAVNPPGYQNWETLVLPMLENTILAAEKQGARILLPGTVYNYGKSSPDLIAENTPQSPSTVKGKIRKAMEVRLRAAAELGRARVLIVRAGDFMGPEAGSSWFSQAMVPAGKPVKYLFSPGKTGAGHSWAYLPDLAETMAQLLEKESSLLDFEVVQFRGYFDHDGRQLTNTIKSLYPDRKILRFQVPWWLVAMSSPFSKFAKEVNEVSYFWEKPIQFDNQRLVALLGAEPHTPMKEAIRITLNGMGCT